MIKFWGGSCLLNSRDDPPRGEWQIMDAGYASTGWLIYKCILKFDPVRKPRNPCEKTVNAVSQQYSQLLTGI
jgi:hypothetical protein